jgi:hypothetical protein
VGSWQTAGGRGPSLGRVAAASGVAAILCAGCTEAPARCRAEVAASFERLRTSGSPYRKETTITIGDHQTFYGTAEYVPPDRMREVKTNRVGKVDAHGTRFPADETTSEVIRVGARAWEKERTGWREWEPWLVQEMRRTSSTTRDTASTSLIPAISR